MPERRRAGDRLRPFFVVGGVAVLAVLLAIGALVATAAYDARTAAQNAEDDAANAVVIALVNREIGWQRGSVDCLELIVDDDRTFAMPPYCVRDEVVPWYPPDVCPILGSPAGCGERSDENGPGG